MARRSLYNPPRHYEMCDECKEDEHPSRECRRCHRNYCHECEDFSYDEKYPSIKLLNRCLPHTDGTYCARCLIDKDLIINTDYGKIAASDYKKIKIKENEMKKKLEKSEKIIIELKDANRWLEDLSQVRSSTINTLEAKNSEYEKEINRLKGLLSEVNNISKI